MNENSKNSLRGFKAIAFTIWAFALLAIFLIWIKLPDWQSRGQFGDMFGALNALFTSITLVGVIYTIFLQSRQMRKQEIVNKETLASMSKQLKEMQLSRIMQAQPLPIFKLEKFSIKKPRFFYSPPDDEYSVSSHYVLEFALANPSEYPAINVDIKTVVMIPAGKEGIVLDSSANRFNIIPPSNSKTRPFKGGFQFFEELCKTDLLECIRSGMRSKMPCIFTRITYKNVLGSCFGITQGYYIDAKERTQDAPLANYQSTITTHEIEFKTEIEKLRRLHSAKNDEAWDTLFQGIKKEVSQKPGPGQIELRCLERPDMFRFEILEPDVFEKEQNQTNYGSPVPKMHTECPALAAMQKGMDEGAKD